MPIKDNREYRAMSLLMPTSGEKRFDSDFYVEGYATNYQPYLMYESSDGVKYYEVIDRNAFNGCDISDVILQYDHNSRVYARTKMAKNKPSTLIVEPNDNSLFVAANLALTEDSRKMYDEIDKGLIYQMSWAFTVGEDSYDRDTHTRKILKVKKIFDVSAVSIPANNQTTISARSYFDGVIEVEKREAQERENQLKHELEIAKARYYYFNGGK